MVEMKQKDRKKTKGRARRLVNGMFGDDFIVKNWISKRFKCQRIQDKMVEVKEGYGMKDEKPKMNGIAIQTNKMGHQEVEERKKD